MKNCHHLLVLCSKMIWISIYRNLRRRGYSITADDNLIDILKFEVKDSILHISTFYIITGKKQLDITVKYNQLNAITTDDGKIISDAIISADDMAISTHGYSRLDIQLSAAVTTVNMEGNSKAQLNIDSDSLAVTLKDKIDANLYTVSSIHDLTLQDDAIANIEGTTDSFASKNVGKLKIKSPEIGGRYGKPGNCRYGIGQGTRL